MVYFISAKVLCIEIPLHVKVIKGDMTRFQAVNESHLGISI